MLFRCLAHADIADCGCHQNSFGTLQRTQHDFDRKLASILPPSIKLNARPYLLRQRIFSRSKTIRYQPFREALWDDIPYFLSYELIAAIPELFLRLDIQQNDLSATVDNHHRVRGCL